MCHLVVQKPPYDIDDDVLHDGIVDGALDGGIDAVYVIFNGEVLDQDSHIVDGKVPEGARLGHGRLEIVVIQTKLRGVGTTAIEKLIANLPRLMDLGSTKLSPGEYNEAVLERFEIARAAWRNLAGYGCDLTFTVVVGTLSDVSPLNAETEHKVAQLRAILQQCLPGVSTVNVSLEGAPDIVTRHRRNPPEEFELPIVKELASGVGHVALVKLRDYARFVEDGAGRVRVSLLDENIRDFQGDVEVNKAIVTTLESGSDTPFWWLNNGITIVCRGAIVVGETFKLTAPKVVNGLQTTRVVHDYLAQHPESLVGDQLVQVRILSTEDADQRDAIIRATNSQTPVDSASLRATDDVQKDIEAYFRTNGVYYDRRKGSYRDVQLKDEAVVSIRDLGQALTSMILGRPDEARGKPSSLLKDDARYASIFGAKNLATYLFAARLLERVDAALSTDAAGVTGVQRRYIKLHVLAAVVAAKLGFWDTGEGRLDSLIKSGWLPTTEDVIRATRVVMSTLEGYNARSGSTLEKSTKAQGFTTELAGVDWDNLEPFEPATTTVLSPEHNRVDPEVCADD